MKSRCVLIRRGIVSRILMIAAMLVAFSALAGCKRGGSHAIIIVPDVKGEWGAGPDMPAARAGAAAVELNGSIYVMGGVIQGATGQTTTGEVLEFDPVGGSYTPKALMNTPRFDFAACVSGGKIYAFGGCSHFNPLILASAEVYDPIADSWTPIADMPLPRYEHVAGDCGGEIYINGGGTYGGFTESTTWCYDPGSDTWTGSYPSPYADMPTPRRHVCGTVLDGLLWVAFGVNSGCCSLPSLQAYDPLTDSWQLHPSAPSSRYGCACAVLNGTIFTIGGGELPGG